MSAFTNRIRRAILGPTNAEINAQVLAEGGPGYPIPPIASTAAPTNTVSSPVFESAPHVRWVLPHDETPLDINRPDQAAASAAIAAARWTAPPAIVCDACTHAAFKHSDEDSERPAPSCIGEGPGYACPCTHTCQQINGFEVPAHTYAPGENVPKPTEYNINELPADPARHADKDIDVPVSAPPAHPTADSGFHALDPAPETLPTLRIPCATCGGHGNVELTVNGLLNESLALIPADGGDQVIHTFYSRLLTAAPHLAPLFPRDLLDAADGIGAPGPAQRDKLLGALEALADLYGAGADAMGRLDAALARFGRAHAAFQRPDGSTQGATEGEYDAVRDILIGTFIDLLGAAWKPEYTAAWVEAYSYAKTGMLWSQWHSGMSAARYPRRSGSDV